MRAVDYAADYLTAVCDYVKNETLHRHFGEQFLQRQKISYVITVPAIWSDKAKDLTKQAAQRAGIARRKLVLITEPEAAAPYVGPVLRRKSISNQVIASSSAMRVEERS